MLRYLEALLQYKFRFAVILVVLPALLVVASVALFPTYKGSASLWAASPSSYGTGFFPSGWNQYLSPADNEAASLTQLMKTAAFANLLVQHLDDDGYIKSKADRDAYLTYLGTNLTISTAGSHLVLMSVTCDRATECLALLKETIASTKILAAELQKADSQQGIDFLDAELTQAQTSLRSSEDALQKYLAAHPGLSVTSTNIDRPLELDRLVADAQDKRNRVQQIQSTLGQAQYYSSASATLIDAGPRVIDEPRITRGGLTGDGSSLKRGLMAWAVLAGLGAAYLWILVWIDKTVRDVGELERSFKLPVVTTIPQLAPVERL